MIRLENLTKAFSFRGQRKLVADNVSLTLPAGKAIGLLGRNGSGKSTLLRIIAGTVPPDRGRVITEGQISWPVGLAGGMHPDLTGMQNTRFLGRIYGVDTDELVDFVQHFSELGIHFKQPVRTYSSGMRARLSFGISMGIRFDYYLVDEVTSVGDMSFRQKSAEMFKARMEHAGGILVTHAPPMMRNLCEAGMVLHEGHLTYFDDVGEAIDYYHATPAPTVL